MKLLISLVLVVSVQAWAHADKKKSATKATDHHHEHREHGAHQHGVGIIGVAFEGLKGKVEFKIPAESIVGFEHEAKKESDIKKQSEALVKFESKINEMLVFESSSKCVLTKEKIEVVREEEHKDDKHNHKHKGPKHTAHSDFVAHYNVTCEKSPAGTDFTLKMHSQFKKIKKLELQLIVDNLQKAQTITKDNTVVSLK
jgi:hypothetical protein